MHEKTSARSAWTRLVAAVVFLNLVAQVGRATARTTCGQVQWPVAIWPSGPLEVVAAFDTAIDPAVATSLLGKSIPYFVPVGTTRDRTASPRPSGALRIVGARLTDDDRTLILATDPHPRMARYLLPLSPVSGIRQSAIADDAGVAYDLSGAVADWSREGDPDGEPRWSGWWPLLDSESARLATRGSKRHEAGLELLSKPGRLVLSTLLRLPPGSFILRLDAAGPIEDASAGDVQAEAAGPVSQDALHHAELAVPSRGEPIFLTITVRTGQSGRPFSLKVTYRSSDEKTPHALEREQLAVPWAPVPAVSAASAPLVVPDLAGGDPVRGRSLFSGDQARCSQCHAFRGQGGIVGPDLTEIGRKSRAEIYRSIAAPGAAIDPDYVSYTVATRDGQVVVGLVRAEGADAIKVTDTNARSTLVPRRQLQQIRPSATSIMPIGLAATFGDAAVRDLIAYLTEEPAQTASATARLLSFDELQKKLGAPELRLLDVRDQADYAKGHIPGAIWVDLKPAQQLSSSARGLTDQAAWEKWIEPLGIGPATEVVIYDAQRQLSAARTWWLLSYLGVKGVGLIDGGFPLWTKQGRPVTTEVRKVSSRPFRVEFQSARLATRDQVLSSLKAADRIVDARSRGEYTGLLARSKRGGHIPAACHLEWSTLVDADGRFLDAGALRARLESLGIKAGRPVITHCQSGGRASVNAFVLERLGLPTRNYYLGWSDWGNAAETPVEAGSRKDGGGRRKDE
ncbi:MAG: rhodanese-like domain-containing protein [Isosphaerales bacterium]